jgi:DNA-binding CsgD family transcriptional regulator
MTFNQKTGAINQVFEHQTAILQICKDFLIKHQLAFFGYLRCYQDRTCYVLSTRPDVYQYLLQAELPLTPSVPMEAFSNRQFYYLIPNSNIYGDAIYHVSTRFNLYYPLDIIFRSNDYYEMFCYGINQDDFNKINYYLNNLCELKQFTKDFREKAHIILGKMDNTRIILPDSMFNPVKHLIIAYNESQDKINAGEKPIKNGYTIWINNNHVKLTKREHDCLNYLLKGKTARETAHALSISRRTVETHLDIVKQKTFSRNKIDLISKLLNAPNVNSTKVV